MDISNICTQPDITWVRPVHNSRSLVLIGSHLLHIVVDGPKQALKVFHARCELRSYSELFNVAAVEYLECEEDSEEQKDHDGEEEEADGHVGVK